MHAIKILAVMAAMGLLGLFSAAVRGDVATIEAGDYRISGPYTHSNLTVYLIHAKGKPAGNNYLTLQEAMEQKKVIVHETGDVNELAIENVSDEEVYVQSGDIVKGGRQDRTLAMDSIVPAHSGKIPVMSFCVEHSRWTQRGNESAAQFGSSAYGLSSKSLKVAAKYSNDQSAVWRNVASAQGALSSNAGTSVNATTSPSSLQLTLEDKTVQDTTDAYVKALASAIDGKENVVGYAFSINGKLNSADVYASDGLFTKLWPKMLRATSVEAFADLKKDEKFEAAKMEDVRDSIVDAAKGKADEKDVTPRVKLITQETDKNVLFETRDGAQQGAWIHRNYMTKDSAMDAGKTQRGNGNNLQLQQTPNGPSRINRNEVNAPPTTQPQAIEPARSKRVIER